MSPDLIDSVNSTTLNTLYNTVGPAVKNLWDQTRRTVTQGNLQYAITIERLRKELELSRESERVATARYEDALKKSEECLQAAKNYRDRLFKVNDELDRMRKNYEVVRNYAYMMSRQQNSKQIVDPTQSTQPPDMSSLEKLQHRVQELEEKLKSVNTTISLVISSSANS